ncbi:MAG: phosphoenolpyruvate carboxylase [Gaiellales bacterium]
MAVPASDLALGTLAGDDALLERLLFEAITQTEGLEIVAGVERLHTLAERARTGDDTAAEQLRGETALFDRRAAGAVAKALLMRLQAANLSEERERVRRLQTSSVRHASLAHAVEEIGSPDAFRSHLDDLHVELVLTMHPSDATRRAVLHKLHRLTEQLDDVDRALGPEALEQALAEAQETIAAWWATDEVRRSRPPIEEEIRRTVFLVESALYDAAADVAIALEQQLGFPLTRPPLSFVQWAGGDMDGNPSATGDTVRFAVVEARRAALRLIRDRVVAASRLHSEASRYTDPAALLLLIERDATTLPGGDEEGGAYAHEPLRRKLRLIRDRLTWTMRALDEDVEVDPAWTYRDASTLIEDLQGVRDAAPGATPSLDRLVWQARIFGLHLLEVDIRLHARELGEAVDALLPEAAGLTGTARVRHIADAIALQAGVVADAPPDDLRAALSLSEAARLREAFGSTPLRSLVISGCEAPEDILAATWLLQRAGLHEVPVVPLFESGSSLRHATGIADAVLAEPSFRAHIDATGSRFEVMLGHSDGGKEEGFIGAQWRIWRAQEDLVAVCRRHGIGFRAFHGRGGSPARGAVPPAEIARALPAGAASGGLRLTEQGEAARSKLAHPVLARRALEQILSGAVIAATRDADDAVAEGWREEMDRLADAGRTAWRDLLDDPAFPAVFTTTTPIGLADDLKLGSRPARRASGSADSLRAIPWVMAWTQTRVLVPAWFGAGSALAGGDVELQRAMRTSWPQFRAIISTLEAALFRTDLSFANDYLAISLAPDAVRIWEAIRAEHAITEAAVLAITGETQLYERRPELRERLAHRNPWIDPLSAIQTDLLRRLEAGDESVRQPLLTTMAGIAAGVQSVG